MIFVFPARCTLPDPDQAKKIKVTFAQAGQAAKLRLRGGPSNNVHIRIELPHRADLKLRALAGDCRIIDIEGNKDIQLRFGEISVSPVTPAEYGTVAAAVRIGEVAVPGEGVSKAEFLRQFTDNTATGKYHLRAHVTVGQISFE